LGPRFSDLGLQTSLRSPAAAAALPTTTTYHTTTTTYLPTYLLPAVCDCEQLFYTGTDSSHKPPPSHWDFLPFLQSATKSVWCSGDLLADEHINQREVLSRIIGINRDGDGGLGGEVLDGDAGLVLTCCCSFIRVAITAKSGYLPISPIYCLHSYIALTQVPPLCCMISSRLCCTSPYHRRR
jgi:hypothetical protein